MKTNIVLVLIVLGCFLVLPGAVQAIPSLQLDILGGTYDWSTQTIVSNGSDFTLYAYLNVNKYNKLSDTYYLSAALIPRTNYSPTGLDIGSFTLNGNTIDVTADMLYGTPPAEANLATDPGDLAAHGIYSTYFYETGFQFNAESQTSRYDTQLQTGRGIDDGTGMYFMAFNIDTSNIASGYQIHFDLYNTTARCNGDIDVNNLFAPFSHDAESSTNKVPEPSSLLLLGSGLIGLAFYRLRS